MQVQPASKIRIFLIEDQALIRMSLRIMLEQEPELDVVGEAANAERALQEMEALAADVVLVDIGLPCMNGIEFTRLLKEKHRHMAVVMLTSYDGDYVGAAIEAGASGYIIKTCSRKELSQAVRAAHRGQMSMDPALVSRLVRELAELRKAHSDSLLTPRQLQVLNLIASGKRHKEIADTLFVSESTVNREVRNIFDRLGVNDAAYAVSEAYKRRLI